MKKSRSIKQIQNADKLEKMSSESDKITIGSQIKELASEEDQTSSNSGSEENDSDINDDSFYDSESDNSIKMVLATKLKE